jgi:threonine dehydrogenase-like Zn-dependent dehydrogenase
LPTTNRKLGPVLGKVVAVVGQGQNGLIATRLMSQFAAKAVIAIDPVR